MRLTNAGVRGRHLRYTAPLVHLDHPRGYRDEAKIRRHKAAIARGAPRGAVTWTPERHREAGACLSRGSPRSCCRPSSASAATTSCPGAARPKGYDAGYDFRTLAYDAVATARAAVWLFCPKLAEPRARCCAPAEIRSTAGRPASRRVRRFERYDIAELPAPDPADELSIALRGWRAEVAVSPVDRASFAGRNVPADAVEATTTCAGSRDWVRFHVREHGADAVLFFDNGSTGYGVPEIEAALAGIDGIGRRWWCRRRSSTGRRASGARSSGPTSCRRRC